MLPLFFQFLSSHFLGRSILDNKLISDTRERILDVVERQSMASGYEATSMRAITRAAEVNMASVNLPFGSKEGLLREVFWRRLTWPNKEPPVALDALVGERYSGVRQARYAGKRP